MAAKIVQYTQQNWPLGVPPSNGIEQDVITSFPLEGITLNQPLVVMKGNNLRTYFAIQNNGSGVISIGIGEPTEQGILLMAGGSYERWYKMTSQPFFVVPLYTPVSTDFVSVVEGSIQGGS